METGLSAAPLRAPLPVLLSTFAAHIQLNYCYEVESIFFRQHKLGSIPVPELYAETCRYQIITILKTR